MPTRDKDILSMIDAERINKLPEPQRQELLTKPIPHVEIEALVLRMRQEKDDKYGKALFGTNFDFTLEEVDLVKLISEEASRRFEVLTENDPQWKQFLEVLATLKSKGTMFVENVIDDKDNVRTARLIVKTTSNEDGEYMSQVPGISASKRVKALYQLSNQLEDLASFAKDPKSDKYHGQQARTYANKIELANIFVQQTTQQIVW